MSPAEQYNRSLDLLEGRGVARDERASFALNAEAAASGHHDAVLAMGWYYSNGVGVDKDIASAKKWYRRSARQGAPKAMFSLGAIAQGEGAFEEALTWFRQASELKHARSHYWIGKLYWRGNGVERDPIIAKKFFERAAAAKDPDARRVLRYFSRHAHDGPR